MNILGIKKMATLLSVFSVCPVCWCMVVYFGSFALLRGDKNITKHYFRNVVRCQEVFPDRF